MTFRQLPPFFLRFAFLRSASGAPAVYRLLALGLALVIVRGLAGQAPATSPLTLLSKDGRRALPVSLVSSQEFVALDDLATVFSLTVREESGALTVSYKGKTIVLTPDQALASAAGRLVSLPAPPARAGRRWLVPLEFISRALAPIYDTRLDLRKPSHLLVVGDIRVPRVTIRFEPLGAAGRLTVDAAPRTTATVSQESERLSIKFDAEAIDAGIPSIQPQGLVQSVHLLDPVTLVVNLGPRFAAFRATTVPSEATSRVVIDFVPVQTEAAPTPAAAPPPPAATVSELPPAFTTPISAIRTIAIDAGHGGEDEGAKGVGGTKEKDLTLTVARRAKAAIEGRLGIRVLLTRDEDRTVTLDERTAMANNNKADVFISLHANASLRRTTTGAIVFHAAFDREADQAARASLGSERLPAFGGGSRDIELVRWDLAQIRHVEQSAQLAKLLEQQFHDRVALGQKPIDRAPLRVLESANMPAVVIEMGYLSNPDQEKQLISAEFQNTFVQALSDAVVRFRNYLEDER